MMRLGPKFRQAIRGVTRAQSPREVARALATFGRPYGLSRLLIAELVLGYARPEIVVFLDTMGRSWRENMGRRDVDPDPLFTVMIDQRRPLLWSEIARIAPETRNGFIGRYRELGFADGISTPIWGPNGYWAWAIAGSDRELSLSEFDRDSIQLLAMLSLTKCRLIHYAANRPSARETALTAREADILYWVLEGKTDDEIGVIVGLTRATIKFHVRNAMSKLGSANRVTAAVAALKSGLLLAPLTRHAVVVPPPTLSGRR